MKDQSWEELYKMFITLQKDYKKKHQQFQTRGNHSNNFHDFCHGRLDTYYMHVWLSQRDPSLLHSIVEDVPEEVKFEMIGDGRQQHQQHEQHEQQLNSIKEEVETPR
jgi:hypothetical protein